MKKKLPFILSGIVALLLLLLLLGLRGGWGVASEGRGLQFNPDVPEAWSESLEDPGTEGIKIPGFSRIYFEAGTKEVHLTLGNPAANTCYFTYEIYLDDPEGELLYSSCRIDPGMALTDITLSRPLEAGEYTLYIKANPCELDSGAPLNSALLKAPLVVVNS